MKTRLIFLFLLAAIQSFAQNGQTVFSINDFKPLPGNILRTNVYFDLNKSTLRPESKPVLDSLVHFLQVNNGVVMRINRYGDKYNPEMSMRLGNRRAKAIHDYLVYKGIDKARLYYTDYGTNRPLVPQSKIDSTKNLEEKQRLEKMNRRTEFEIVRTDYVNAAGIVFADTLLNFVTDSFRHNLGKIQPVNTRLRKPFKVTGSSPVIIERAWTGDPHFICEYPKEPLFSGKVYWMTVCFAQQSRRGPFNKAMGFTLSDGQTITFVFTGEVVPE